MKLVPARSAREIQIIRELFSEYADTLGVDLSFQNFQTELASLPGCYAQPDGCLILATVDQEAAGCVALRTLARDCCEMKRLYVRREFRGRGIGRRLVAETIRQARRIGYERMRLDTLSWMTPAIRLYESLGFRPIPPYRYIPFDGATYMELRLR